MKRIAVIGAMLLAAAMAWAQTATVRGLVLDFQGKPLGGVTIELTETSSGRKYGFQTDKEGRFYALGVGSGKYNINLVQGGRVLASVSDVQVSARKSNTFTFDLRKSTAAEPAAKPAGGVERSTKKIVAAKSSVTRLNRILADAKAAEKAQNFARAVQLLTQATQIDPKRDLLWANLGEALIGSARRRAAKEPTQAGANFAEAANAYRKAIAINPGSGAYHNNLGEACARLGQTEAAVEQYRVAAQVDPQHAATYYFNEGAVLINSSKAEQANAAFDKAIAADPRYAEAYYQKAVILMAKATTDDQGNYHAPTELAADLKKYLELSPDGPNAPTARQMLAALGAKVETSWSKGKSAAAKR